MSTTPARAFLYARKSTDDKGHQIYSIDHQIKELRALACRHDIHIVEELVENRTAKTPGRPVFNQMLSRIKKGEASTILAWHPDRLARNAIDGGAILHLIDTGTIADIKCAQFWFEPTPQGMLMLSFAFGMSKYYVDSLSEGIKRNYRQRIRDGYWPRRPPLGYLFDRNTRTAVLDPIRAPLVRQMFERYATGHYALDELTRITNEAGLRGFSNKHHGPLPLSRSQYYALLQNPFVVGMMRLKGELFEGKHEPLIPLSLFDKCQLVLAQRGKRRAPGLKPFIYRGMFTCGECGCMITSEAQKGYTYLRCTKRKGTCHQSYLRLEDAQRQVRRVVANLAVPDDVIDLAVSQLEQEQKAEAQSWASDLRELKTTLASFEDKHRRLTDLYIDGSVPAEEYHRAKERLLRSRRELSEKIAFLEKNRDTRLEPAIRFIRGLAEPRRVAEGGDPEKIRDFLKKVGSNLTLRDGKVRWQPQGAWKHVAGQRFSGKRAPVAGARQTGDRARFSNGSAPSSAARRLLVKVRALVKDSPAA